VATSLLPVTNDLIARLAGLPFTPVLVWPMGHEQWLGIGLGDLLFVTAGPLVFRKAFGRTAGNVAIVAALGAIGVVFLAGVRGLLPGTFPVMVVLGPLLVVQYVVWIRIKGEERTTVEYLRDDPFPISPATVERGVLASDGASVPPMAP